MHCHSCSFMFRVIHVSSYSMVLVAVVRSFISCQVPHRGHAHRGRHRLQATVLDQGSRLMVHVGLVRFVTFLSGTAWRTASANDGRLSSGTMPHVCSLVLGLLLPGEWCAELERGEHLRLPTPPPRAQQGPEKPRDCSVDTFLCNDG